MNLNVNYSSVVNNIIYTYGKITTVEESSINNQGKEKEFHLNPTEDYEPGDIFSERSENHFTCLQVKDKVVYIFETNDYTSKGYTGILHKAHQGDMESRLSFVA